jgi:glycerol-3-phosphate dehydrogenase (NAD(P)+)
MTRVAVLGAGAWGTALGKLLGAKGQHVMLLTEFEHEADLLNRDRCNERYLPGVDLPASLRATARMDEALAGAQIVIIVVPSDALRSVLGEARPHLPSEALVVIATKGIENGSLMTMGEVLADVLGPDIGHRGVAFSGPSFANEVAAGMPTAVVAASTDARAARAAQHALVNDRLRIYTSDDPVGVQVGGALKNVIALAAGASDGLGFGHNARAALITRGLAEIGRLAVAKGGQARTLAGLAGLGDLVLTCTGELSRNRTVGFELGRGRELGDVLASLGHVAEGVKTAKSAYHLAARIGVDMPITAEVYRVLYEGKPPRRAVEDLMHRALKDEY